MSRPFDPSHQGGSGGTILCVAAISTFVDSYVLTHRYTPSSRSIGRKILGRFVSETGDPEPTDLTRAAVEGWWRAVSARGATASLRAYHSTVRGFLEWMRLPAELMAGIARPKPARLSPRTLSASEVDLMRMSCTNLRDRAIIELAWGAGLRCMEIAQLQVADIDWTDLILTVHSKGGHVDELPLAERVALAIDAYYQVTPAPLAGFVIRNRRHDNRGITTTRVTEVVAGIAWKAGVKKAPGDGRGAHGLRRTFATDLLKSGVDIRDIQCLMRHESLASTEYYLRRSTTEDLRRALANRIEEAS